jgi:tetratricopeptide (TPR) repeat protein
MVGIGQQNNLKKYLEFAEEQFQKGDYYYALQYYEKAMDLDSQSVDIIWNYAETQRAYKNYRKAEFYYQKVYNKEEARIYPSSLLQLGLMQKQNGKYAEALATFKKAKKKYYKDKKGYLYKKAKKEIVSTVWAKSEIRDTLDLALDALPETVNTKNSEFGHTIYNDQLIFSSLRADSISAIEEVYTTSYHTNLYSSNLENNEFRASERIEELFTEKLNSGNGTFSLDGNRFYFSQCTEDGYNYRCKIMVARYSNGSWSTIDSLGEIINTYGTNTTMPCIANLDGKEVLIFASDREDTKGGLDIFYSVIKNGNQYGRVRSIKTINSMDNEITPWWDSTSNRLYFSSSWHNGFGGYDVFYSEFTTRFNPPKNAGLPVNSSANDLYYFKHIDTGYVTSNRIGVLYSKNPTCCSDIFSLKPPVQIIPPTPEEKLEDLMKRLPVTLYFHNDRPNPDSWAKTTDINYIDSYHKYTAMLDEYKKEYSKGLNGDKAEEAKEDIESFFIEYVDQGVKDLELFRDLLLQELDEGARINITVKGFASPLAKTDYNVNLTKRRIASLVNYMREFDNGVFVKYLDDTAPNGGKVVFSEVPFGEYTANQLTSDNPNDVQNSVYSRAAAIERKIEIQSVSYLDDDEEFALSTDQPLIDLGATKNGELIKVEFDVTNNSSKPVEISNIRIPCDCTKATTESNFLNPGETTKVSMEVNTDHLIGFTVKSIYLQVDGSDEELRLYISTEISE